MYIIIYQNKLKLDVINTYWHVFIHLDITDYIHDRYN